MHSHGMITNAALSLTLAVIRASIVPTLLLDDGLKVLGASTSFLREFHIDPGEVTGREVFALGGGAWDVPQLRSLLTSTAAGVALVDAYEMDLLSPVDGMRSLIVHARLLNYRGGGVRVLLTVNDVTEARLENRARDHLLKEKEDLIREKAILLQELQHRVANSLQIIASVMLQSARRTQSEEGRDVLRDAHHRVMSVAALQRQLAKSQLGRVHLHSYLDQLCASIGASLIPDPGRIGLSVKADESLVDADTSISLGLIVTELVINALKHGFPDQRSGAIAVSYAAAGSGWTLSVRDDGVGMPDAEHRKPGLGASIVEALAHQLKATIHMRDGSPGTIVEVSHLADGSES